MTDVSFATENRVCPDIIKRYPDVLELVAKVTDEKTKAELNGCNSAVALITKLQV